MNNGRNKISCDPFFIIGSGRSGNTLLRAILTSHSKISIPPESFVLGQIIKKWSYLNYLDWEELVKLTIGEFESHPRFFTWDTDLSNLYTKLYSMNIENQTLAKIIDEIYTTYSKSKFPNSAIWGDKTPLNTENIFWISKLYPNAKYIHIIRDGRDVINSYLNANFFKGDIYDACEEWEGRVSNAKKFGKQNTNQYLEIKYENLVISPKKEIIKVCKFLNINFEDDMIDHTKTSTKLGDVTKMKHHAKVMKPIDSSSIGKYKKELTKKQIKIIEKRLSNTLKMLGYNNE